MLLKCAVDSTALVCEFHDVCVWDMQVFREAFAEIYALRTGYLGIEHVRSLARILQANLAFTMNDVTEYAADTVSDDICGCAIQF